MFAHNLISDAYGVQISNDPHQQNKGWSSMCRMTNLKRLDTSKLNVKQKDLDYLQLRQMGGRGKPCCFNFF